MPMRSAKRIDEGEYDLAQTGLFLVAAEHHLEDLTD